MKPLKPGPLTAADRVALRGWQRRHGLKVDGKPGHESINHLLDTIAIQKTRIEELSLDLTMCRQPDDPVPVDPAPGSEPDFPRIEVAIAVLAAIIIGVVGAMLL